MSQPCDHAPACPTTADHVLKLLEEQRWNDVREFEDYRCICSAVAKSMYSYELVTIPACPIHGNRWGLMFVSREGVVSGMRGFSKVQADSLRARFAGAPLFDSVTVV